jgi:hypothetical protein
MHDELYIGSLDSLQRMVDQQYRAYLMARDHWVVRDVLRRWKLAGWAPIVFGGVIRDLVLFGINAIPKDVDVVIVNRTLRELHVDLSAHIVRETRFGGLQLNFNGTRFDVWPLYRTWAFQNSNLPVTAENLTKTTFLNIEAVAGVPSSDGVSLRISENGFIEAVNSRTLDINFGNNPFPDLAATRAIITAKRLNYGMSRRLLEYITRVIRGGGLEALTRAQKIHYGRVVMTDFELKSYLQFEMGVKLPTPPHQNN